MVTRKLWEVLMFGYVKVNSAELKVKEYEFWRSTYCGLCRSMGKCTGQCSRMTLSYDFVFLALVRIALLNEQVEFEQKRCLAHPLKKRNSMKRNEVLDYCADAAAILNYRKIEDDLKDEKGVKKLKARLAYPLVAHARKKALRRSPELCELDAAVERELIALSQIENDDHSGVDSPADSFGSLLGALMSFGLEGSRARIAFELGRGVGGWIYIADAIDDMGEDLGRSRYNPIIKLYGGRIPNADELEMITVGLRNRLLSTEAAFDLMDSESESVKNIIANILFLGITSKTEDIIKAYNEKDTGKEDRND